MNHYEIYAIKYAGPFKSSSAFLMWQKDWEKTEERNYYIWCIRNYDNVIIVDAGVAPPLAGEKMLVNYENPAEMLSRIGVEAEKVKHLIITHMHWDHSNGVGLFPNARLYIQESEYNFWVNNPVAKRPAFRFLPDPMSTDYIATLMGTKKLTLLKGDQEILPGIRCMLAPGHSVGIQAVTVNTGRGTAIVGSDCAHVFRNYSEDWPTSLTVDMVALMETYEKLRKNASSPDLIFPGHDVLMATNYPQVAENITKLV